MITIIEKLKEGKAVQREMSVSIEQAERILNKSKGWALPEGSKYVFKDGALLIKGEKSIRKKKKPQSEEPPEEEIPDSND